MKVLRVKSTPAKLRLKLERGITIDRQIRSFRRHRRETSTKNDIHLSNLWGLNYKTGYQSCIFQIRK